MQQEFRSQLLNSVGSTIVGIEVTSNSLLQPYQEVILDLVDDELLLYSLKITINITGATTTRFKRPPTGTTITSFLGLLITKVLVAHQAILFATNGHYLELQLHERTVTVLTNKEGMERWKLLDR